jgi:hypothetical protein
MNPITSIFSDNDAWFKRTALYQEFLAEREEIQKHKWLASERAGRDIGLENALVSWVLYHRAQWRRARMQACGGAQAQTRRAR